jgi:hypothetical protein
MASTTVFPRARRAVMAPLRKRARAAVAAVVRPARPVLANAAQIPLTITGYGCLSGAAFTQGLPVGLASSAVLLIVLEHQLADEP